MNRICITFDIDWAKDEIVQYIVDLLQKYRIKATFFATHGSDLLKALNNGRYEIGIHPNFNSGNDHENTIRELMSIYPKASGIRSHGLFQSSSILQILINNGLKYDVNTFIPFREGLYPFMWLNKLVRIPYYWEDDTYFCNQAEFGLSELQMYKTGLKIYNFHPIHIFMNTDSMEHYNRYKSFYHQPAVLTKHQKNTGKGIRTLFIELLEYLNKNTLPTYTCGEVCHDYLVSGNSKEDMKCALRSLRTEKIE